MAYFLNADSAVQAYFIMALFFGAGWLSAIAARANVSKRRPLRSATAMAVSLAFPMLMFAYFIKHWDVLITQLMTWMIPFCALVWIGHYLSRVYQEAIRDTSESQKALDREGDKEQGQTVAAPAGGVSS